MAKKAVTKSKAPSKAARLAALLGQTRFSLADLDQLGSMSTLRDLRFKPGSAFAKGGLANLSRLRNLQFLSFQGSKLSAKDLAHVAECSGLRRLSLEECTFPAKGLTALADLPRLTDLWLERTSLSDSAAATLARISTLEWLVLDHTRFTDKGLAKLASLPELRSLALRHTKVTDAGVQALVAAPKVNLSLPYFHGTSVTKAALDAAFAERRAAQKRGLESPAAPAAPAALAAASEVVRGFVKVMHEWEKACAKAERQGKGFDHFRREQDAVFARFCTNKERKYGRQGSYSRPPEYDPRTERIESAEERSRSRVEIVTERSGDLRERRLYVLLKKAGEWRIDSVKSSVGGAFRAAIL